MAAEYKWAIAITLEPDRDWEGEVVAVSVQEAIIVALHKAEMQPGELVHMIHIGPPRPQ